MNGHGQAQQPKKSRVLKIDSEHSWDSVTTLANDQGCPVVVHFTAAWCVPSVAMKSCFEELALRYPDILFLAVDVDDLKGVASKMDVKAMPTFVMIRKGAQGDKLVGANPDEFRRRVHAFVHSFHSAPNN